MGAANTKIEEDKALVLCRERKHFVRQAIDQRCSLAAAHVAYIQSLRNVGIAFKNFVDPEGYAGSLRNASTFAAATEPLAAKDKPVSHLSNSSPSLSHVETAQPVSPSPSSFSSKCSHVNHMLAGKTSYMTVEEKPPTSLTATLHISQSNEISSFEPAVPPRQQPWDYFGLPHPADNQPSFQNVRRLNQGFDDADEIICLKKEEGIPDLKGDKASANAKNDLDSEDDFDQTSNEPMIRMFRNRIMVAERQLKRDDKGDIDSETKCQSRDDMKSANGMSETDETPEMTPSEVVAFPLNRRTEESNSNSKGEEGGYISCMKEIEDLFLKASESGSDVPRMLEANKMQFRPLFPEGKSHRPKASAFLTSCVACCKDETPHPQVSARDEVKHLTWDRSASLLSFSSVNFLHPATKDVTENLKGNLFNSTCMNSGSHASTLDRLYAWERKLYDEVKASGIIRREYDMKCRVLRHKESSKESSETIDKTRAVVKDLHSRIRVAIHRIDSISKKIEEIRDKELQPQLEELIEGLTRMWRMMLDYHNHQLSIISSIPNNSSTKVSIGPESEDNARVLENELKSLCSNFTGWISAHKSYINAINSWLRKFVPLAQKQNKSSKRKQQPFCPKRDRAPPIFITCQNWLLLLDELPTEKVASAMTGLVTVTTHFLSHQEKGHRTSNISFSSSLKAAQSDELEGLVRISDANWSLKHDNLRFALKEFLDKLKSFAESSVSKYNALHDSINSVRAAYVGSEFRK